MQRISAIRPGCRLLFGLLFLPLAATAAAEEPSTLDQVPALSQARKLLLGGSYAEGAEAFQELANKQPVAAALGLAECQSSQGKRAEAAKTLAAALKEHSSAASLHAAQGRLRFQRGDQAGASESVAAALKLDEDNLSARWTQAELHVASGRLKEADAAHRWLVDYYNDREINDARSLRWIGRGAAEFARWNRLDDQFRFLVSTLYPDVLKLEPANWIAHYETGLLFLEKYNQAEATRSLGAAMKLNPNAAEVHAALGRLALQNYELDKARRSIDRAIEINPALIEAYRLKADLLLANFKNQEAAEVLQHALTLNPRDEKTLGRIAAVHILRNGKPKEIAGSALGKILAEANARNPHAGVFYFTLAETLSERRKFPASESYYQEAIERMPQLVGPRGQLGMMYMRLGDELQGKRLLDESFEIDPFNVRVSNMLKVLDVLAGYAVIETEHFIIRFDRGHDELLAQYAADYLENEVYPQLCKQFDFEPDGKSLFEIFNRAKNTGGHGWFSARMVGLPYVGTVGACAGKMVAITSPAALEQPFNWARVLKHEFVHVLNLQQTNFNTPHWFTEALAVLNEDAPRPEMWNKLLAARVPAGEIFHLDTINLGFIRPSSQNDWHMAYCQAEIYAQYLLAAYGEDSLAKMLTAYADNLNTREALKRCFDVEQEVFERGYLKHLKQVAAGLSPASGATKKRPFAELVRAQAADPENPDLIGQLAYAYLQRESYAKARKLAQAAVKLKAGHPMATYVLARIRLLIGEARAAHDLLEGCLDEKAPHEKVLTLLAALKIKARDLAAAERLYRLGRKADPHNSKWIKALASLYLKTGENDKLAELLVDLADLDGDDIKIRKKLAQIALEKSSYKAAANWANQAVQINVMDSQAHRMLAEASAGAGQRKRAVKEYKVVVKLTPKDLESRMALAQVLVKDKQPEQARLVLEALLGLDSDHEDAARLLETLKP